MLALKSLFNSSGQETNQSYFSVMFNAFVLHNLGYLNIENWKPIPLDSISTIEQAPLNPQLTASLTSSASTILLKQELPDNSEPSELESTANNNNNSNELSNLSFNKHHVNNSNENENSSGKPNQGSSANNNSSKSHRIGRPTSLNTSSSRMSST